MSSKKKNEAETEKTSPGNDESQRESEKRKAASEASRAMATLGDVPTSDMMPFTPTNFAGAFKLAEHLAESGCVPDGLKDSPGSVFSVMARGTMMGLHWSVAVQEAYVVYGRVAWPAAVMDALVGTSPEFEYFEVLEATSQRASVEAKKYRWKEARVYEVTIEEASDAGYLDGKHSEMWLKRPKLMLIAMCRREAARMWDPARFAGLYTPEELASMGPKNLPADAPTTAALESFGEGAAAAVVDVESTEVESDDRVRLSSDLQGRIRKMLESAPVVSLVDFEKALGCPLGDYSGEPGTDPSNLYTECLSVVKKVKQAQTGK